MLDQAGSFMRLMDTDANSHLLDITGYNRAGYHSGGKLLLHKGQIVWSANERHKAQKVRKLTFTATHCARHFV